MRPDARPRGCDAASATRTGVGTFCSYGPRSRFRSTCFRPNGTARTVSVAPYESTDPFGPPSGPATSNGAGPISVWERL